MGLSWPQRQGLSGGLLPAMVEAAVQAEEGKAEPGSPFLWGRGLRHGATTTTPSWLSRGPACRCLTPRGSAPSLPEAQLLERQDGACPQWHPLWCNLLPGSPPPLANCRAFNARRRHPGLHPGKRQGLGASCTCLALVERKAFAGKGPLYAWCVEDP